MPSGAVSPESVPALSGASERCGVCDSGDTSPFFSLSGIPVQDGLLWATREEALASPVGDIRLVFCRACGHIANSAFEPGRLRYDRTYDISLHHSPVYREFIDTLTRRLSDAYRLRGGTVLEIACGNGDFLRELCRRADARGIGFDPSLRLEEADTDGGRLCFVADFYSDRHGERAADLICSRHLLQSLPAPAAFLRDLRRTLGERRTPVYVEVPNALHTLRETVIWYVISEYCSYFTPVSLRGLFRRTGFEVLSVSPCFQDQYLGIEVRPGPIPASPVGPDPELEELTATVSAFRRRSSEKILAWRKRLDELRRTGRRVVAWGAGGRAITFLTLFRAETDVPCVVDINPKRQGLFLPATGQPVVAPEALPAHRPDVVLITNPAFEGEIREQVRGLGLNCDFLVLS